MAERAGEKISRFLHREGREKRQGGLRVLFRKGLMFVEMGLAMLVVHVLRALRPLVKVRVGRLNCDRIGNLAPNAELFLRWQARRKDAGRELHVFVTGKPANRQLLTMIRRRLLVTENPIFLRMYGAARARTRDSDFWIELPKTKSNEYDEFNNLPPQLAFDPEEETRGQQVLASMDIEPGVPFVCFHARDKAYLDTVHNWRSRDGWSYHDYRDCNICNYLPAAEYLASLGLFAVRMGYVVERALPTKKHLIIDYATLYRSDFGDIYLPAKCKFFIGNACGLVCVPYIFNVPVALTNWIPLGYAPIGRHHVFILKKLWSCEKKRFLTFREILACGGDRWVRTQLYTHAGIEVIENTAGEILALAKEMNGRLDGTWVTTDEDEELQQRYRALFPPDHPITGYPSRVGAEFLRANRELLD